MLFDDGDMLPGATLVWQCIWQAYIGTAPNPRDVFCVKYVPSGTVKLILMITSVVVFSCLVVVVVVIVIYCRQRCRRRKQQQPTAAVANVAARYSEVMPDQHRSDTSSTRDQAAGNVRISFQLPQFDDDDGNVRWVSHANRLHCVWAYNCRK